MHVWFAFSSCCYIKLSCIPRRRHKFKRVLLGRMVLGGVVKRVKPYLAMVFLQFGYAGVSVVSLLSLKHGMSHYVLAVYRNIVATMVLAPFALWFERKVRPKMTRSCFLKIMALALLEPVLDLNLYYLGNIYTSASFATALLNIVPAVTFVMAILLRMEKVKIKRFHSQAKIMGTLVTVVGALLMILYKGPVMEFVWTRGRSHRNATAGSQDESHWLIGTFLLLGGCLCWSSFFILQSHTLESYPAELSLAALICLMGAVEGGGVALVMERSSNSWSIGWDARLFTAVYSGVMCSGVAYYVQGIVMKERGPVFVTAFNPLCTIIVAVLGSFILAEEITLGRLIGAVIIVIGLYSLIWGKSKDHLNQPSESDEKKGSLNLPIDATDACKSPAIDAVTVVEIPISKKFLSL